MTQGMKSSEFILAVLSLLAGGFLTFLGAKNGDKALLDNGLYMILGSSGSYSLARGLAKFGVSQVEKAATAVASNPDTAAAAAKVVAELGK